MKKMSFYNFMNATLGILMLMQASVASAYQEIPGYKTNIPSPSPSSSGPSAAGKVTLQLKNMTQGKFANSQLYWAILGVNPLTGQMVHLDSGGNLVPVSSSDISQNINGVGYANYSYSLDKVPTISFPEGMFIDAARIYLSVDKPLMIKVVGEGAASRFGGPDMANPSDPNYQTYWDFAEFTYNSGGMWANITRVDMLGFPVTIQIISGSGQDNNVVLGETESRADIFKSYCSSVPAAFKSAKSKYRIVAPGKADLKAGGKYENYLAPYIDSVWSYYQTHDIKFYVDKQIVQGRINGNTFDLTTPWGATSIAKPTTAQVVDCSGPLGGGDKPTSMVVPVLCRAFNRGLFKDVDFNSWGDPGTYYKGSPTNYYSKFVHDHSINGLTYGFAYDDDQSGILTSNSPKTFIIGIGW